MGDDEVTAGGKAGGRGEGEGDAVGELPITEIHQGVAGIVQLDELQRQRPEQCIIRRVVVDFIDHRRGVHQGSGGKRLRSRGPRGATGVDGTAAEKVGRTWSEAGNEAGETARIDSHGRRTRPSSGSPSIGRSVENRDTRRLVAIIRHLATQSRSGAGDAGRSEGCDLCREHREGGK